MFVLAFDRDWTVDVNPPPDRDAVPLEWVIHWAHETDHEVWAIGNQNLVYEAGIPGIVELVRQYHGDLDMLGEQDEQGYYDWWPKRERRLEYLRELFPDAHRHIVIDDIDLSHVDGWDHYTGWDFREALQDDSRAWYQYPAPPSSEDSNEGSAHSDHVKEIRNQLDRAKEVDVTLDDEESFRSREWEKPRPATRPPNAAPCRDFETQSGSTRRVELPDIEDVTVVEAVPESERTEEDPTLIEIEVPDRGVLKGRAEQADVLTTPQRVEFAIDVLYVAVRLEAYPMLLLNAAARRIEDLPSDSDEHPAVRASRYAAKFPNVLERHVPDLCDLAMSKDEVVRRRAAWLLSELAEQEPGAVLDAVPTLSLSLDRDDTRTRSYAVYALSQVAREYPEELLPALDQVLDQIGDENETIRTNALSTIGRVASGYPDAAADVASSLAALLSDDEDQVRNNATGLLGDIAVEHQDVVIQYVDELVSRLGDSHIQTRINASIALLRAGEADPEAISSHAGQLADALDDPSPEVRANACALIANSNASVPLERLRELREEDQDETVRDRAGWAVEQLS